MIRLEMVQGQVEIQNKKKLNFILPRKGMTLDTSNVYHYVIKSGKESWAVLRIDDKDVVLRPESTLSLTNDKAVLAKRDRSSVTKLFVGTVWAWISTRIGHSTEDEYNGNAAIGVRG